MLLHNSSNIRIATGDKIHWFATSYMLVLIGDSYWKNALDWCFLSWFSHVCVVICEHTHSFACNSAELAAGGRRCSTSVARASLNLCSCQFLKIKYFLWGTNINTQIFIFSFSSEIEWGGFNNEVPEGDKAGYAARKLPNIRQKNL